MECLANKTHVVWRCIGAGYSERHGGSLVTDKHFRHILERFAKSFGTIYRQNLRARMSVGH
jgi:hypothetical protein